MKKITNKSIFLHFFCQRFIRVPEQRNFKMKVDAVDTLEFRWLKIQVLTTLFTCKYLQSIYSHSFWCTDYVNLQVFMAPFLAILKHCLCFIRKQAEFLYLHSALHKWVWLYSSKRKYIVCRWKWISYECRYWKPFFAACSLLWQKSAMEMVNTDFIYILILNIESFEFKRIASH